VKVDRLWKENGLFAMTAGDRRFESRNVIVAMANYQVPYVPEFGRQLTSGIRQLHSNEYRNPSQLQPGEVLVVGVGNSGADIAMEVARTHPTWISGKEAGHVPSRIDTAVARYFLVRLVRFVGHHVLAVNTPVGRKIRPKLLHKGTPLVRVKPQDLTAAGITRVGRVTGVTSGLPQIDGGAPLEVSNIIWCTGFKHGFPWIDLPVFGPDGEPEHRDGVVEKAPGLYFVGLHFLHALSSATLFGVDRDARRVVNALASREAAVGPCVTGQAAQQWAGA
jgi:putative flavoprotein involved in K+ transport